MTDVVFDNTLRLSGCAFFFPNQAKEILTYRGPNFYTKQPINGGQVCAVRPVTDRGQWRDGCVVMSYRSDGRFLGRTRVHLLWGASMFHFTIQTVSTTLIRLQIVPLPVSACPVMDRLPVQVCSSRSPG